VNVLCAGLGVIEDAASTKLHYLISKSKPSDVLYKSLISIVSNCVSVAVNDEISYYGLILVKCHWAKVIFRRRYVSCRLFLLLKD
jgi:hypothetical protein